MKGHAGAVSGRVLPAEAGHIHTLVERRLKQLQSGPDLSQDRMLFLGNRHEAIPQLIFKDPVLQSIDRNVYCILRVRASDGHTALPTYEDIANDGNIGSPATISRALAVLRLTRWLSLYHQIRRESWIQNNVYILHDEPLSFHDAFQFDRQFMGFAEKSLTHTHSFVRQLADMTLQSIKKALAEGDDFELAAGLYAQRNSAAAYLNGDAEQNYYGIEGACLQFLKSGPAQNPPKPAVIDQNQPACLQFLKSGPLQKSKNSSSSSSFFKETTTTAICADPNPDNNKDKKDPDWPEQLIQAFSPNEYHLLRLKLNLAPPKLQQDIINEMASRIKNRDNPIRKPYNYFGWLCDQVRKGRVILKKQPRDRGELIALCSEITHWSQRLKDMRDDDPTKAELQAQLDKLKARYQEEMARLRTEKGICP